MKTRTEALREICGRRFDVCVIGAGATGAGCALDAQLRGLETVLVDAGDFASATSSASTKLVHGGVRYLQQAVTDLDLGQLKVVRRALHERILLLKNAPHLAHRLETLVPCRSHFEMLYYGIGLWLYDWIAGRCSSLGASRRFSREQSLLRIPSLEAEKLIGAVTYIDGQLDDARYGVTLVKTFAATGGEVANYLKVVSFERNPGGKISTAILEDALSGARCGVRAGVFVNATGPFSDSLRRLASPGLTPRLVLSRGVHILLPLTEDAAEEALLIPKTEDGRVIFAIPWRGRLLVGTTDRETTVDEELIVQHGEAEYLLGHLNRYLARPREIREIVSGFAGIRPLVRKDHARATRKLVRDHEVEVDQDSGLISILGGKWTTYRAMAEDTINVVQRSLGQKVRSSGTSTHVLAGGEGYNVDFWRELVGLGVGEATAHHLGGKFGTNATEVIALTKEDPELGELVVRGAPAIRAEIVYAIRQEMAVTIEDVLARRIGLQYFSWDLAANAAAVVAGYLARELGWSDMQRVEAVRDYASKIQRMQSAVGIVDCRLPVVD